MTNANGRGAARPPANRVERRHPETVPVPATLRRSNTPQTQEQLQQRLINQQAVDNSLLRISVADLQADLADAEREIAALQAELGALKGEPAGKESPAVAEARDRLAQDQAEAAAAELAGVDC
jgi:hypothetical protein